MQDISNIGKGGAGLGGQDPGSVYAALKELQGLNISLLAGATANTKLNLAGIRTEDSIVSALNNNAGTLTDITGTISIVDTRASGTITLSGVTAGQTVTVAGLIYTAVAGTAKNATEFSIGGTDAEDAVALAAAIITRENGRDTQQVSASAAAAVVTVTAVADGTAGNSVALVKSGAGIALSGANLAGGTATGGIKSSGVTNQVILFWFNRK